MRVIFRGATPLDDPFIGLSARAQKVPSCARLCGRDVHRNVFPGIAPTDARSAAFTSYMRDDNQRTTHVRLSID